MNWCEQITKRIAELEADRARFVEAANRQVAAFEGGIAELKKLLADAPIAEVEHNGHASDTEVRQCPPSLT